MLTILISIPLPLRFFLGLLIQIAPFAVLCAFPFVRYFRYSRRKTILITAALILSFTLIYAFAATYISSLGLTNLQRSRISNSIALCGLIPCFFWYLYAIKTDWQKKVFVISFSLTSALFTASICSYISNHLPGTVEWPLYTGYSLVVEPIVHAIVIPTLCLFLKHFYMPVENGMNAKENDYLGFLSLFLFLLLAGVFSYVSFAYLTMQPLAFLLFVTLFLIVFILYSVVFKMYSLAHEKQLANEKYMQTIYQMDIRDEQYRRIHERLEHSYKLRHDLRHHLLIVQGFLEHGETDKMREYLAQYLEQADSFQIAKVSDNPIVNMLVCHYDHIARENDITFVPQINIPDTLSIQNTDLSVLLGNLLENATEAARNALKENRSINLKMLCSKKMLMITVDNGFNGTIKQNGEQYLSTKQDHRGLGLKSISEIAQKYDGKAEFTHEAMVFHSSVLLGLEIPLEKDMP